MSKKNDSEQRMGVDALDYHSLNHFVGGFVSFICLKSIGASDLQSFTIANGVHLIIECLEHNQAKDGRLLESFENHVGDIVLFAVGWFLSRHVNIDAGVSLPILWCVLIFVMLKEIVREVYPYSSSIFHKGAFISG